MHAERWILVLEPDSAFRRVILEEVAKCRKLGAEVVEIQDPDEIVPTIAARGTLPVCIIAEWLPRGKSIAPAFAVLENLGFLPRLFVVALAGHGARQALTEAHGLGVRRFIAKFPDLVAFRGKTAEVIAECEVLARPGRNSDRAWPIPA